MYILPILLLLVLGLAAAYILLIIFSPSTIVYSSNETHYLSAKNPQEPRPLTSINEAPTLALSIVVPAYNERERLGTMVDEAMEYLTQIPKPTSASSSDGAVTNGHANKADDVDMTMKVKVKVNVDVKERLASRYADGVEFIIVDDGSKDDTTQIALEIAQQWDKKIGQMGDIGFEIDVRIVKLEVNRGKGGSVRHGVLFSRGKRILFVDADGASRFSDLELLETEMDKLEAKDHNGNSNSNDGHGIVVGSRAHMVHSEAVVKRSFIRNLLMHGFHIFLRTLGVSGVKDTQCGFKLFTRPTALTLFPSMHLHRWSFDVELLLVASMIGITTIEVPIVWHEVDGSKISVALDGLGMARDLLVLRGNLALGRWSVPKPERRRLK